MTALKGNVYASNDDVLSVCFIELNKYGYDVLNCLYNVLNITVYLLCVYLESIVSLN